MNVIIGLIIIAVLIQAIVEAVKQALTKWDWIAITLGVIICPLAGVDAFALLGQPLTVVWLPWLGSLIGSALTGVVVSRGASFVYDIWRRVKEIETDKPPDGATE